MHRFYQEQYQLHGGKQDLYVDRQRRRRSDDGLLRHDAAADLHVPAQRRSPALRDRGRLLPGRVRRLVPQPPVADRRGDSAVGRACRRTSTRSSTRTGCRTTTRSTTRRGRSATRPGTIACGTAPVDAAEPRVRRLRGQHDPAAVPADELEPDQAPAADGADDRRRADARRTSSWAWYSGGWSNADGDVGAPGWTNGHGADLLRPELVAEPDVPVLPEQGVPVPPSAVQLLRELRPGHAGARAPAGRGRVPEPRRRRRTRRAQLNSVSFIKPIGLENEHPGYTSEAAAATTSCSCCSRSRAASAAQGHDGRRHLRRVRRPVGSRVAARPGRSARPARQVGPRNPHPGADRRAATLRGDFAVDHTQYDTTSIMATIEHRWSLPPLSSRDAAVNDLSSVFSRRRTAKH